MTNTVGIRISVEYKAIKWEVMLLCIKIVLTEVKGESFTDPLQGLKQGMKVQKMHAYAKYHHGGDHDGKKKKLIYPQSCVCSFNPYFSISMSHWKTYRTIISFSIFLPEIQNSEIMVILKIKMSS